MTTPTLAGVEAKIARAKHHLEDIRRLIEEALDPNGHEIRREPGERPGAYVYRVEGLGRLDQQISVMMGDYLFNLRSALDHLAWQLVLLDGGTPTEQTKFPILESPRRDATGSTLTVQLDPTVRSHAILEALEAAQPYSRMDGAPQDARSMPLWAINKLNNIDKHRLLLVLAYELDKHNVWWELPVDAPSPSVTVSTRALEEGAEVASFRFAEGAPTGFRPHLSVQIALREDETPRYRHENLLNVLDIFRWCVEEWIVEYNFRPLFTGQPPNPFR
jgi:hypothetical protein